MKNTIAFFLLVTLSALNSYGQQKYKVVNRQLTSVNAGGVHLSEAPGAGVAWINGKQFTRGAIEFDVKGRDKLQASFVGIAFHGVNDSTYECVYFRPFNFRAADPERKGHAVQYIALPGYDWPKLRAGFPNKYEQPITPAPDPDAWLHVRIEVSDKLIAVYVNHSAVPSLKVSPLVNLQGKMIGCWAGNGSDGDWKNIKVISAGE
jgi:hypothetical protein